MMSAVNGRVETGSAGSATSSVALPSASVDCSMSIGVRVGSTLSSARPKRKPGKAGERGHRLDVDVALDREVRRGCAVEVTRREGDGRRLARADRLRLGDEIEGEALRLEILDQHRGFRDRVRPWGRRRGARATSRAWRRRELDVGGIAAEAAVGEGLRQEFDAVRPLDDERQRKVADGVRLRVADERGEVDDLARPVDAALRRHEHVERARRRAAVDAAVGQIEGRAGQIEEGVVSPDAVVGVDELWRGAAGAAGEARDRIWRSRWHRSSLRRGRRC